MIYLLMLPASNRHPMRLLASNNSGHGALPKQYEHLLGSVREAAFKVRISGTVALWDPRQLALFAACICLESTVWRNCQVCMASTGICVLQRM